MLDGLTLLSTSSRIRFKTVSEIQKGIVTLNQKINGQGYAMFHIRTLDVMAQVSAKDIEEQLCAM
jgi:hypothetical protein